MTGSNIAPRSRPTTAGLGTARLDLDGPDFRDLAQLVLRPLAERLRQGGDVRVWVPGSGADDAAYAIAFELTRQAGDRADLSRFRVFATDTTAARLEKTSAGRLDRHEARPFLKAGFRRNLSWAGDHWQIKPLLRGRIICSVHDPIATNPFGEVDLVYAHGALAHTPDACNHCLFRQLVRALAIDGVIAVPPAQRHDGALQSLIAVDPVTGLFRRPRGEARRACPAVASCRVDGGDAAPPDRRASVLFERVVDHFAPRGLVVDGGGRVVATTGAGRRLLIADDRTASETLATSTSLKLRSSLVSAFVETSRSGQIARLPVPDCDDLVVLARPLDVSRRSDEPLWLLLVVPPTAQTSDAGEEAAALREHLVQTSESLRQAMEELASRNTTLRTANDELQSSIDELERSNRQFAAMNTELMAVRQEHEHRIEELNALNLDVQNLFRATDLAMVVLDARGRLRRYTPSAGRFFRLARTDLGRPFTTLLPDTMPELQQVVRNAEAGGSSRQLPVALREGQHTITGLARVHPYQTEEGGHGGTIITVADVSDLKAAQESLQHQNVALTRANEDLERFAYIASHDLKSPLRSVRTMLEFLRSDLGEDLPPENREHLSLVAERVQQMEQMIQDLLTYSRLGREARPPETVATREVVTAQVEMLDVPDGFTVTVADDLPELTIDVGLFEHVVRNLVDNAIKHHDRDRGEVRVEVVAGASSPTFAIVDDGPGIPARYQERIFEIFQKPGARSDAGGSGMGLALVKKAVQRNGGTIEVASVDGRRGTTFRFTWPERAPLQDADQEP